MTFGGQAVGGEEAWGSVQCECPSINPSNKVFTEHLPARVGDTMLGT